MKYAVSPEGVNALNGMAQAIENVKEEISSHAQLLKAAGEGQDLGPHSQSIISAGEDIESAINGAADPIEEIAEKLRDTADGYENVIDNDRIRSAAGN